MSEEKKLIEVTLATMVPHGGEIYKAGKQQLPAEVVDSLKKIKPCPIKDDEVNVASDDASLSEQISELTQKNKELNDTLEEAHSLLQESDNELGKSNEALMKANESLAAEIQKNKELEKQLKAKAASDKK